MTGSLEVLDGGIGSTIQDGGRHGFQRYGITSSGAMDKPALRLTNLLVGNPAEAAAVEITGTGLMVRVHGPSRAIAYGGPAATVKLNGSWVAPYCGMLCEAGDEIFITLKPGGLRGYLAIAGGFDLLPVLGSLSTHSRYAIGGFNGLALRAGDQLPLKRPLTEAVCLRLPPFFQPRYEGRIRVILGPQDDHFTADGIAEFLNGTYQVSDRADRMGLQLSGTVVPLPRGHDIVSDGITNGSVQIPGSGRPLILLADRPTTGGYPKIATVIGPDLPKLAQLGFGAAVQFQQVFPEEALIILREAATAEAAARAAMVPATDAPIPVDPRMLWRSALIGGFGSQ